MRRLVIAKPYDAVILGDVFLADNPSIYLPLNEPSGSTTYADLSGNGYDFTRVGAAGQITQSALTPFATEPYTTNFSGVNEQLQLANDPALAAALTGNSTVGVWMRASPSQVHAYGIIFQFPSSPLANYTGIIMHHSRDTDDFTTRVDSPGDAGANDAIHSYPYKDDNWYHMVMVRRGAQREVWRNGVKVLDLTRSAAAITAPDIDCFVGAGQSGVFPFTGNLAQLVVYPYALDPARIAAHYAARLG